MSEAIDSTDSTDSTLSRDMVTRLLGRQPILGREQQLLAYELFYRDGVIASASGVGADAGASLLDAATQEALGSYRCYLNVDQDLLFSALIEALPPQIVVLELLASVVPTADVLTRCRALRGQGFTLAVEDVDDVHASGVTQPLLELADIIKLDVVAGLRSAPNTLSARVALLKPLDRLLLAANIENAEQLAFCQQLGFDLFQGYYFAQPTVVAGRKLNSSQVGLMRLLALVMADAETGEIEDAFKREPALTINLLRLTNSVGSGLSTRITSLRHAIAILGRRQLQRWLQLLVYTMPGRDAAAGGVNPLLQLAATRGRLMELLAERVMARNREFADQAFMVGILSLMPALLGIAMTDILDQLPVASRVRMALTDSVGQHGQLLQMVMATEQIDPSPLEEACARLPNLSQAFIEQSLAAALSWANHLGQE